jgi:hypothetical protein
MTTVTVNIDNKKSEKIALAVLETLGLNYKTDTIEADRPLNKKEQELFERLKSSFSDIKKWEKGELSLKDARAFLNEVSS